LANPVALAAPSINAIKLMPVAIFPAVFRLAATLAPVLNDFCMQSPS
jgi:hypothetical protein